MSAAGIGLAIGWLVENTDAGPDDIGLYLVLTFFLISAGLRIHASRYRHHHRKDSGL